MTIDQFCAYTLLSSWIIHHITISPMSVGLVAEPKSRISNKRIFQAEDIDRLAAHFKVDLMAKKGQGG